jgi:hypothetical protein
MGREKGVSGPRREVYIRVFERNDWWAIPGVYILYMQTEPGTRSLGEKQISSSYHPHLFACPVVDHLPCREHPTPEAGKIMNSETGRVVER